MIPPNTAQAFIKFMEMVWEGGPLYDRYENAVKTARFAGAVRTGGTTVNGESNWVVYRFPADQGEFSVRIKANGSAVTLGTNTFSPRLKRESVS